MSSGCLSAAMLTASRDSNKKGKKKMGDNEKNKKKRTKRAKGERGPKKHWKTNFGFVFSFGCAVTNKQTRKTTKQQQQRKNKKKNKQKLQDKNNQKNNNNQRRRTTTPPTTTTTQQQQPNNPTTQQTTTTTTTNNNNNNNNNNQSTPPKKNNNEHLLNPPPPTPKIAPKKARQITYRVDVWPCVDEGHATPSQGNPGFCRHFKPTPPPQERKSQRRTLPKLDAKMCMCAISAHFVHANTERPTISRN